MCTHATFAQQITEDIGKQLYPCISTLFAELLSLYQANGLHEDFNADTFFLLKSEFESLKNYETKLVFPSILKVFDSEATAELKPCLNIKELQSLTRKKEQLIVELLQTFIDENQMALSQQEHPICKLTNIFQEDFNTMKHKWHTMLDEWATNCSCFKAAQKCADTNA